MNLRLVVGIFIASLFVGLASSVWLLSGKLSDARLERDMARAALVEAYRAIDALASERAAADRRYAIVQASRETILALPETDNGPVAPVLQQALDAADRIGGYRD